MNLRNTTGVVHAEDDTDNSTKHTTYYTTTNGKFITTNNTN